MKKDKVIIYLIRL